MSDRTIDLNCDLGEGCAFDAELMPLITSANVACGGHAGDLATALQTIALARRHGQSHAAAGRKRSPSPRQPLRQPLSPFRRAAFRSGLRETCLRAGLFLWGPAATLMA